MSDTFVDLVSKKPIKKFRAKRNASITSITLIIESVNDLGIDKASGNLLEVENGLAEIKLESFIQSNEAFIDALIQEDAEIDQSEKFKADQIYI